MSEQQSGGRRQTTYTNSEINSYERSYSAMSFTFADGRGLIALSPIFEEFVGQTPKKGDSVYDHDSKMNFSIDAQAAVTLRHGIRTLLDDEDEGVSCFHLRFGGDKNQRTLSIYRPNTLKLGGKTQPNFLLRVSTKKDDTEEKMYHLLQRNVVVFKTSDGEVEEEVETDLILLLEFAEQVIANSLGVYKHGARQAGGGAPAQQRSAGKKRSVVEEEDGDGDSSGDGESESSGRRPGAKAGAGKKKVDIDTDFDE